MDLTIRNGTVATASETMRSDVGIEGGKIVAIADRLPAGKRDIDAAGRYVLPGGVSVRYPQVRSSLAGESLDILF